MGGGRPRPRGCSRKSPVEIRTWAIAKSPTEKAQKLEAATEEITKTTGKQAKKEKGTEKEEQGEEEGAEQQRQMGVGRL